MHGVLDRTFGAALGLLIASSAPAWARCERSHIPWRYGGQVSSVWRTDGTVCTDVPNQHQYIAQIRITERPISQKNGALPCS
jgi:hypothetical protein